MTEASHDTVGLLAELSEEFGPAWHAWQGVDRAGRPSPTCWVACYHGDEPGIDPTVIADSPDQLARALERQRRRIAARTGLNLDV